MTNYKSLPIKFRELEDGRTVISNLANTYHVLDNKQSLRDVFELGQCSSKKLLNELEQKLFITSDSDFESKVHLTTSAFSKRINKDLTSPRLIMIVPTLRCDHHCSYCQVSRVNADLSGFDLQSSQIPSLINYITKIEKPPYKIEFQGGEPLLAFDFIQTFYEQFEIEVGQENFNIVIATSLSLIDQSIINWCKGKNVGFSTSIDAGKKAHNKHRKLITKNSFELVQKNINWIHHELGKDKTGTVTTVTRDGLEGYDELVDTHLALGLIGMFVRPVSSYGFAEEKQAKDISISDFMVFYKKLIRRILNENLSGTPLIEHFLLIHYKRLLNSPSAAYVDLMAPAGYLKNSILIDYTGNVFGSDEARMVYRKYGADELIIGNINNTELNLEHSTQLLAHSFNFDVPGCSDCVYQGSCGSDPIYHLQDFGEPIGVKSYSRFCELHKSIFDFIFELIREQKYKNVLDGWLNG